MRINIYQFVLNKSDLLRTKDILRRLQNFAIHEIIEAPIPENKVKIIASENGLFELLEVQENSFSIGIYYGSIDGDGLFQVNKEQRKALIFLDRWNKALGENKETFALVYSILRISYIFLLGEYCGDPFCIFGKETPSLNTNFFKEFSLLHICDKCKERLVEIEPAAAHLTDHTFTSLKSVYLDENTELKSQLFSKSIQPFDYLPTCYKAMNRVKNDGLHNFKPMIEPFKDLYLVLVLHLLPDFLAFLKILKSLGANATTTSILAKPYPYKNLELVMNEIVSQGFDVTLVKERTGSGEIDIRNKADEIFSQASTLGLPILIVEDGGYLVPYYHNDSAIQTTVIGAVEQTTKGIEKDKKLNNLSFPVVNVAESVFKKEYESPLIGEVTTRNITHLLQNEYISGKKAIVFGYGSVGAEVAQQLRWLGMVVEIVEKKDRLTKRAAAKKAGFKVHSDDDTEIMKDFFLAIGTTGTQSISREHINAIRGQVYLASTSSDQIEIDINTLTYSADKPIRIEGVGTKYKMTGSEANITLLADGYPVNFFHAESVPNRAIDPIMGMLLMSSLYLAFSHKNGKTINTGINNDIADSLSEAVIEDFINIY